MQEAWRAYLELALGVTEASRKKAQKVAQKLVGKGGATATQLQALTEDLLSAGTTNRAALTKLVRAEVERTLGRVGLASSDEVTALAARVRGLEDELHAATARAAEAEARSAGAATGPDDSREGRLDGVTPVPLVPAAGGTTPVGAEAIAPEVGTEPASGTPARKAVAKKAVAKKVAKKVAARQPAADSGADAARAEPAGPTEAAGSAGSDAGAGTAGIGAGGASGPAAVREATAKKATATKATAKKAGATVAAKTTATKATRTAGEAAGSSQAGDG